MKLFLSLITSVAVALGAWQRQTLVELRVKPLKNTTAFRLTLNTLVDPKLTAATIAIGNPPTLRAWPAGANERRKDADRM